MQQVNIAVYYFNNVCDAWWLIGIFVAFLPESHEFESHSSRHDGTLDRSFTRSCLCRFGVKLQAIRAVFRERL